MSYLNILRTTSQLNGNQASASSIQLRDNQAAPALPTSSAWATSPKSSSRTRTASSSDQQPRIAMAKKILSDAKSGAKDRLQAVNEVNSCDYSKPTLFFFFLCVDW